MCLAFVAIGQNSDYPLLLLFNRDEGYNRSSLAAHWWNDLPVFAGRDQHKGGTWAAVDRSGKFAMLTFIRAPREARTPTIARGEIVPNWMQARCCAIDFIAELSRTAKQSLGYNLIFGDLNNVYHFNNRSGNYSRLAQGIYGVSNGDLEDPWFKVLRGKQRIHEILGNCPQSWEEDCFSMLADKTLAPEGQVQITGLDPVRERLKSGIFVHHEGYGTIASSYIRYSREQQLNIVERSFDSTAECFCEVREEFAIY